jgi:hypothetical protein
MLYPWDLPLDEGLRYIDSYENDLDTKKVTIDQLDQDSSTPIRGGTTIIF